MKAILYSEWNPEDLGKIVQKNREIQEERKKFPDRYPNPLSLAYTTRPGHSFRLYEGTEEQFINLATRWVPETKAEIVPIFESTMVFEAWEKLKK